jgi:hypothetical protein
MLKETDATYHTIGFVYNHFLEQLKKPTKKLSHNSDPAKI